MCRSCCCARASYMCGRSCCVCVRVARVCVCVCAPDVSTGNSCACRSCAHASYVCVGLVCVELLTRANVKLRVYMCSFLCVQFWCV